MVNRPEPDRREIITRTPFVDDMVGEMVAHLRDGMPHIDVEIKPLDTETEMHASFDMIPKEARRVAAELMRIADEVEQAAWTPQLLAHVRERYLPGKTDAELIGYLKRLADRDGGLELGPGGQLYPQDGHTLTALAHRDLVDRVRAALSAHDVTLTELEAAVADLGKVYQAETQGVPPPGSPESPT